MTRLLVRLGRRRILVAIAALLIAMLVCGGMVGAFTATSARDSYVLAEGQTYDGHLTVVARVIDIRDGSTINGDVSLVALENATIGGHINGDLSIIASGVDVYFRPDLDIQGDLSICARSINGLDSQHVEGDINKGCDQIGEVIRTYRSNMRGADGNFMSSSNITSFSPFFRGYSNFGQVIVNVIVLTALAGLGTALLPTHHQRLVNASIAATLPAAALGFVTIVGAVIFSVIYAVLGAVTLGLLLCIGLPIMVIVWVIVNVGMILGWIIVSFPLGAWLIRRLKLPYSRTYAAMLGVATLTFVQAILSFIPCLNIVAALMILVAGSWGLGTVILTRAGFRAYPEVINVKRKLDEMI